MRDDSVTQLKNGGPGNESVQTGPEGHFKKPLLVWGTAVAQWLRCCATNRKVAGSIPDGVMDFFIDIILPIALWPWGRSSL